jgi:hypothetical protein
MMRIDTMMVDQVARCMAANAGIIWDTLNDYPGYTKNYWREQARALLRVAMAQPPGPGEVSVAA